MSDNISDSEFLMIFMSKRRGYPLIANGVAETRQERRDGIPLGRVAEQIERAIKALHAQASKTPLVAESLLPAMLDMLAAYLSLYNMLGATRDRSLPARLLLGSRDELQTWLNAVALEGDVHGLAALNAASPSG